MTKKYYHNIRYSCNYDEGYLILNFDINLENNKKITSYEDLLTILTSQYSSNEIEVVDSYYYENEDKNHRNITKVKLIDGKIIPVFEVSSKVKTMSLANEEESAVSTKEFTLEDDINNKFITLESLELFKSKIQNNFISRTEDNFLTINEIINMWGGQ